MQGLNQALVVLPEYVRAQINNELEAHRVGRDCVNEIRVRLHQNIYVVCAGIGQIRIDVLADREIIDYILGMATKQSMYAYQDTIGRGYITIKGGHRVGVLGEGVAGDNNGLYQKNIAYINIRIAHDIKGCSYEYMGYIGDNSNVLIISEPGAGKTTMLRDIARNISYGNGCHEKNVVVIDERGELSGTYEGQAYIDLGPRTDVCSMLNKSDAVMMCLRAMSPEVMVLDEIDGRTDAGCIRLMSGCGVRIIASAHGYGYADMLRRLDMAELIDEGVFGRIIILSKNNGPGTVEELISLN